MKLDGHFDEFLRDTVNLNATRVDLLEDSISAIKKFIRECDWKPEIATFAAQGSWAHKTIIKPVEGNPFDADLLVYVKPAAGWTARQYLDELIAEFRSDGIYKDKCRTYSHCVTIEYASERKIDVAPCIVGRTGNDLHEVCNRSSDLFERTEPTKYTDWLIECNSWSGGNSFRKCTRLLKYLRDIKETFTCPSVLLTTILSYRISSADKNTSSFADVPTTLKTLVGRLDDWLRANPAKPEVRNPFLYSEVFSDTWDDTKYANFRDKVHLYRSWIDDAYKETDRDESIGKWRRVFGDEFAKGVTIEAGESVVEKSLTFLKEHVAAGRSLTGDMVALVKEFGSRAIYPGFTRLPYMHRPKWRQTPAAVFPVRVTATLHEQKQGTLLGGVASMVSVPKARWLKFVVRTAVGGPISDDYEVHWRVTNTGRAAAAEKKLRGDFYPSDDGPSVRWEELRWRGVHIVEAFVVRRRDNALVSKSDAFFVVIE